MKKATGVPGGGGGVGGGGGAGVVPEQLPGVIDTSSIAMSPLQDDPRTPSNVTLVWNGLN